MKVKPFYIRITDDMTAQDAQDVFDKCIDAGVHAGDSIKNAKSRHKQYRGNFYTHKNYGCLGLSGSDYSTYIEASEHYFKDAQEITLDQLDEWLGLDKTETPEEKGALDSMTNNSELPNGSEWKYGDKAEWTGVEFIYVARHPAKPERSVCIHSDHGSAYSILTSELKKPETPQQREERDRLEAAKDLACVYWGVKTNSEPSDELLKAMLRIVDKTDYRKAK